MIEQINLFPRTTGPKTRKKKVFLETKCRTQRRYKSTVPYLVIYVTVIIIAVEVDNWSQSDCI